MFKTQFDKHDRIFQNPGSPVKVTYAPQYDKNGVLDLVVSGQENLYDYIQSFAESCDIHVLLDRYRDGDASVLSRVQGFYGDVTDMPKTYAEVLNSVIAGENAFMKLPVEIRAEFNHSFAEWMAAMDQPNFVERMSKFDKKASVSTDTTEGRVSTEQNQEGGKSE